MAQNWRYSSREGAGASSATAPGARRTLRDTIDWYLELSRAAQLAGRADVAGGSGVRLAGRAGAARGLRAGRALHGPQTGRAAVSFFPRDEYYMRLALREAERALEHDDVPIGA